MADITRRVFAATAAGMAVAGLGHARAATAYRLASNMPKPHPTIKRLDEAAAAIKAETNGEFDLRVFPASQLGGDLEMLSQVRAGAIQFDLLAGAQLSTLSPVASLNGVGFAFNSMSDVWAAMDGEVGAIVRAGLTNAGLHVFEQAFDNGFRQVTTSTRPIERPNDLKGLTIRVPPSALSTSLFKALGASPQSISFNEVYTGLQTKLVEAQENPLPLIESARLFEVQKFVSMTNHQWDGFWLLANRAAWTRLPAPTREIVEKHIRTAVQRDREDTETLNATTLSRLRSAGMTVVEPDRGAFRSALAATPFYGEWREKFGDKAWAALERYAGKLA